MRPLNLRLENFACFRGRAVELDFAPLELFAIAGPTGAGKSSLLDAIIFSLYGRVPRIGGRGAAEIISLGADRLSVAFDFASDRATILAGHRPIKGDDLFAAPGSWARLLTAPWPL